LATGIYLLQSRGLWFAPGGLAVKPLQNAPFRPISASGSNFNPLNTQCIPAVKIIAVLELERK
jgi:hypothetical protein